jgi:NDP-sugar pyrophosphorylase family protein
VPTVRLPAFVAAIESSPLAPWLTLEPWEITARSEAIVRRLIEDVSRDEFAVTDGVALHRTTIVEPGAVLKGPLLVGPGCFIAAGAYLRGGNWLAERCTLGPGTELKSSFVWPGTALAHFNFVGDSILGSDVNFEAGSIVCNHRNERADAEVWVRLAGSLQRTGCRKFGAVVGDGTRIGANAVLAPGALLLPGTVVPRGSVRDDELAS